MCVSCDLLTGLDLEEIEAAGPAPSSLHLPQDLAGLSMDAALPPDLVRVPTAPGVRCWQPGGLSASTAELVAQARAGHERYRAAAAAGLVHADQRWLWVLPSPFTWLGRSVAPEDVAGQLASVTAMLQQAVAQVADCLPARDLALQWNLSAETALWESRGRDLSAGRRIAGAVLEGIATLAGAWPAGAQLGYHLCRRDAEGAWPPDPLDAAQVSHLAGALLATVDRDIDFLHLPAAEAGADADWYAPLTRLQAWPQTALHVGIAWAGDSPDRVRERLHDVHAVLARAIPAPACDGDTTGARSALERARATG